jgi:hypothetical protein
MRFEIAFGVMLVTLLGVSLAPADGNPWLDRIVIHGQFVEKDFGSLALVEDLAPAPCPDDENELCTCEDDPTQVQCQGFRHPTSYFNKRKNEVVLFGGINGFPFRWPTIDPVRPVNQTVFTLKLKKKLSERKWVARATDETSVVANPWFTTTKGFVTFGKKAYLACDDQDAPNFIWSFDPHTYTFEEVANTEREPTRFTRASDCCAVGLTVPYSHEKRIYLIGGRNQALGGTTRALRYYSITKDEWREVSPMEKKRSHMGCAAVYRHGKPFIYAIGGGDSSAENPPPGVVYQSIEVYNVLKDKWKTLPHTLSQGRTRMGVVNVKDEHLIVVGGDATCPGGGPDNPCDPDRPLDTLEVIDIKKGNRVLSSDEYEIPKLNQPRQTPATTLVVRKSNKGWKSKKGSKYELLATGGHTCKSPQAPDEPCSTGIEALRNTEVLKFDEVHSPRKKKRHDRW